MNPKVGRLLNLGKRECSEGELAKDEYDQVQPEFDERDLSFCQRDLRGNISPFMKPIR